jgi:hypothetical protein
MVESPLSYFYQHILIPVLQIQTLLIQIRKMLFTFIRIRILLSNLIRIRIRLFGMDPDMDPCCFKEVMYLKQYFLYIFTWFSMSVSSTGPTQSAYVKFSLPVNFVGHIWVAEGFGSGSGTITPGERIRIMKNNTDPYGSGSATLSDTESAFS